MTLPHGAPIRIYPSGPAGKQAQPKPGKVRSYHATSLPKADLVTVDYDDGSPPEVVPVSHVERVNG